MEKTRYELLGEENLNLLLDKFYDLVAKDDRINHLFKDDFEIIKKKQRFFLTQFFGGPALYNQNYGPPRMRARHIPHAITSASAEAWLENMAAAVDSLPIEEELKMIIYSSFPKLAAHMVNS